MPPPAVFLKSQRWLQQYAELSKSSSDTNDIEDCLQRLDSPTIQAPFKELSVTDLYILASKRWLSDKHINSCGTYINSHIANKAYFVVDSFYVPALRKTRATHPTWSPRQPSPADKAVLSGTVRYLLIPIHTPGHWTLFLLDLLEDSYVYVDSMKLDVSPPEDLVSLLDWWLSSLRREACSLVPSPRTFQAEEQDDYHSCGPFVMSTMSHIALSTLPWTSSQSHMHRVKWFLKFTKQTSTSQSAISSVTASALELRRDCLSGSSSDVIDLDPIESDPNNKQHPSHNVDPPLYNVPDALPPSNPTAKTRPIAPLPSCRLYKQTQLGFAQIPQRSAKLKKALDKKEKECLKKRKQRARKKAKLQESKSDVELTAAPSFSPTSTLEAIYQGSTTASLPNSSAPCYNEAEKLGMRFEPSKTKTYWATQETMQKYIEEILVPFFKAQIEAHNLPPDQRCVFQIDVWSVHRSAMFRDWMSSNYPWISLQYIPGGCTGLFQACDVGIQRIVKSAMRQKALADMVNETSEAIADGANINTFKNKTDLGTLRNRSVSWMVEGFKAINKPDLVKKAFELCVVPNTHFNLSYKSLTSPDARRELRELKEAQPELYAKLAVWKPSTAVDEDKEEKTFEPTDEAEQLSTADLNHLTMHAATASELAEKLTEHETTEDIDELESQESSDDEFESPTTSSKSDKSANNRHDVQPLRRSARGPKPRSWLRWDPSDFN